jgi:hypothetical protein
MNSLLRALTSLIVGVTTVVGMVVYQHYSREPPGDAFTVAVMAAASIHRARISSRPRAEDFSSMRCQHFDSVAGLEALDRLT